MPRNKNKRNRRSSSRGSTDIIVGTYLYSLTIGSSVPASLLIAPSIFPRTNSVSAVFQNFRFLSIRVTMLPINVTSAGNFEWVLGFSSDVSATLTSLTSPANVSECTPSGIQYNSGTNNLNYGAGYTHHVVNLTRRHLCGDGALKWWKCVGDSGTNSWENFQGQLIVYNNIAASQTYRMWINYVCEFGSPISSLLTLTPLRSGKPINSSSSVSDEFEPHPRTCGCRYCVPAQSSLIKKPSG
jgi:hypothetical protein